MNLSAYLKRINYEGSIEIPTFSTLKALMFAHLSTVPFESLSIHTGSEILVDPDSVREKIIVQERGGYCFEMNSLFLEVLRTIGYSVTPLIARVIVSQPINGNTHLVLRVECEGTSWLVDVGYGTNASSEPLKLLFEGEQRTSHDIRRITTTDGRFYTHQALYNGEWATHYRFNLDESYPIDWVVGSHYCSTHRDSIFVKNIIVGKVTPTQRLSLFNKELSIRTVRKINEDGTEEYMNETEKHEIQSESEYFDVLKRYFGLNFPEGTRLCPPGNPW